MNLKYPIGIETFADIIEGGYEYIDKSEIIYRLISSGKFFFLSRPRRFGKSLMLSTMEAYFSGRKDLFEGLWLGSAEGVDWTPRPVLRLNFVTASASISGLKSVLEEHLQRWEGIYEIENTGLEFGQRFYKIIEKAYLTSGQKVAVLIDEYDKLLVNTLQDDKQELHEEIKSILKPVFSVLKGADRYIEFGILTGVTRFSKLSIFSDINNLDDISLNDDYATICGLTEDEIRIQLRNGVEEFAKKEDINFDEMMQILKKNYDGYHFSKNSPDIYNPFSLLQSLSRKEIEHKWFESGTPTFLVEMMRNTETDIREILSTEASSTALASTDTIKSNPIAVLFQTGYLTIKGYNKEDEEYTLGLPNREVAVGFFRCLLQEYSGQGLTASENVVRKMRNAVRAGDPEEMLCQLQIFLAGIPYDLSKGREESYFQNNMYIIFTLLGFTVSAEYRTAKGRIDILLSTPKYIYVMELKLNGTPEEALQQIEDNEYCRQFDSDPRQLFRIGINFSKAERNIERWIIQ